jgi:DNA-binding NtrC family response regulator
MAPIKVFVVEDASGMRDYLTELVQIIGYRAQALEEKTQFLAELHRHRPDLVLLGASNHSGQIRALAEVIDREKSGMPILVIRDGAGKEGLEKVPNRANLAYLPHGFDTDELKTAIERLVEECRNARYRALDDTIVGQTPAMIQIKQHVVRLAKSDVTVLISGESGTGKELVARSIHKFSPRAEQPFIKVNSAALPRNLLESELFGFEKGAFTGAFTKKPGKFALAHSGTILLDEISEIPLSMQAKLLQVLEDSEFSALGSTANTVVDARVLAATNCNLAEMVAQNRFRSDLYYRLNVVSIHIPPLRERKEDLDLLCTHFLKKYAVRHGRERVRLSDQVRDQFCAYSWPGNLRELENLIQGFTILGDQDGFYERMGHYGPARGLLDGNGPLTKAEGADTVASRPVGTRSLKKVCKAAARKAETATIMDVLLHTHWNRRKAASILEISYKALLNKIKEYRIEKKYQEFVRKDRKTDDYADSFSS